MKHCLLILSMLVCGLRASSQQGQITGRPVILLNFNGKMDTARIEGRTIFFPDNTHAKTEDLGYVVYPLTRDSVARKDTGLIHADLAGRQLFYFAWGSMKTRLYRMPQDAALTGIIDFVLPDVAYYAPFEKARKCPVCASGKHIIPIQYGLPGPKDFALAKAGKLLLGGCVVSEESPRYYCKKDDFIF
ncbi:hypothetical protein [Chitinophaga vietnamensis]|uniref:hypothetical protein n=1 Tax=Chitinophaga vietnamensis TaxID=2593957 RepID=UPI00191C0DEB|nr:hypothetical protein [Chitinophaga vietnamensis]